MPSVLVPYLTETNWNFSYRFYSVYARDFQFRVLEFCTKVLKLNRQVDSPIMHPDHLHQLPHVPPLHAGHAVGVVGLVPQPVQHGHNIPVVGTPTCTQLA